jgi:hypothetical protein
MTSLVLKLIEVHTFTIFGQFWMSGPPRSGFCCSLYSVPSGECEAADYFETGAFALQLTGSYSALPSLADSTASVSCEIVVLIRLRRHFIDRYVPRKMLPGYKFFTAYIL